MRLSEIGSKEIVNLNDGARLGILADVDFFINEKAVRLYPFSARKKISA